MCIRDSYEGNNLRIISKGLSEKGSFLGTNLLLYIENNGQVPITVRDEDTSINGFMVDLLLSEAVSYTHLDVYKRQAWNTACMWPI